MKVGTKSVLFGAHCFFIHPWFVLIAWWKLYGFPNKIQYWVAFFVHDLGYWGKPNMDGEEGETHPEFGAKVMHRLFDPKEHWWIKALYTTEWYDFTLYHSRFLAKKNNKPFSKLCVADKLAISLEPSWLYLLRVNWSGEIYEYMKLAKQREGNGENISKYQSMLINTDSQKQWFKGVASYLKDWAYEHRDGRTDTWTPEFKQAINAEGVWK